MCLVSADPTAQCPKPPVSITWGRSRTSFVHFILAVMLSLAAPRTMAEICNSPQGPGFPQLPQASVDITYPPITGQTIDVLAGESFQQALDAAQPGDEIVLEAGATFEGPFLLPKKTGPGWIVIRSSAVGQGLLDPGVRVGPDDSAAMPKIVIGSNLNALRTAAGAHHYRLVGLEIRPKSGEFTYNLIDFGSSAATDGDLPHHLVIDRSFVHGDPQQGTRRGLALNSKSTAVIHSYFADFKEVGADSQAIAGWAGPGPYLILDNYLEGAGENMMFGGADPAIANVSPADIEIRGNHFFKPRRWQIGHPDYEGTPWSIKNLLELKHARRVLIVGNLLEHSWPHAQTGFGVLFTVRNQNGSAPWSAVRDVTFACNHVLEVENGINVSATDDHHSSQDTQRVLIVNNLWTDVVQRLFQILNQSAAATTDLVLRHNTGFGGSQCIVFGDGGKKHEGFVFDDNICGPTTYGVFGSGEGEGTGALDAYATGYSFRRNAIVGALESIYPVDNFFPPTIAAVGFEDPADGDYSLRSDSPLAGQATDGTDVGVDMSALLEALGLGGIFSDGFESGDTSAWSGAE